MTALLAAGVARRELMTRCRGGIALPKLPFDTGTETGRSGRAAPSRCSAQSTCPPCRAPEPGCHERVGSES